MPWHTGQALYFGTVRPPHSKAPNQCIVRLSGRDQSHSEVGSTDGYGRIGVSEQLGLARLRTHGAKQLKPSRCHHSSKLHEALSYRLLEHRGCFWIVSSQWCLVGLY